MKTIALSMILSLAVIVCEQQTLFAPHFVTFDGLTAANPTNSLVPIAGVNRLVPLSGTSNYCRNNWCVSGGDPTSKNRNSYDSHGLGLFATGSDDQASGDSGGPLIKERYLPERDRPLFHMLNMNQTNNKATGLDTREVPIGIDQGDSGGPLISESPSDFQDAFGDW